MQKLISIDLFADFGMLKKPDTNEPVYLTFNMLHKPALLGILGAITGESGFREKGKLPDYYIKLKDIQLGIQPLKHERGNYAKTIITYNNTTGMASKEQGGNLMITEQTLIAPAYRCYFMIEMESSLHQKIDNYLSGYQAEYLPYLGKNEFSVWWENYREYTNFKEFEAEESFKISSIYIKETPLSEGKDIQPYLPYFDNNPDGNSFSYFERLPIGYIEIAKGIFQYDYKSFAYTDWSLKTEYKSPNVLIKINDNEIIQVF